MSTYTMRFDDWDQIVCQSIEFQEIFYENDIVMGVPKQALGGYRCKAGTVTLEHRDKVSFSVFSKQDIKALTNTTLSPKKKSINRKSLLVVGTVH